MRRTNCLKSRIRMTCCLENKFDYNAGTCLQYVSSALTAFGEKPNPVGTWYFTSAHHCDTILNINHLTRTRSIAFLPCKIVWEIYTNLFLRNHITISFFSLWNGERFLSLVQCGMPSWEGGGGIVWLAAWKLVSNEAKRTVPPPNAKHSTLLQGCFLCFCFWFHSQFDNIA